MYALFLEAPRTSVPGSNVGPVRVAVRNADGTPAHSLVGSPATLSWAGASDSVLRGDIVGTVGVSGEVVFADVRTAQRAMSAERPGHRIVFTTDAGKVRAVSPPFALLGDLKVRDVSRHPLSRQVDFSAQVLHTDGSPQQVAEGLPVEARTEDGKVVTSTVSGDGTARFTGVSVPSGESVLTISAGNVSRPLTVRVGRPPASLKIATGTATTVAVGQPVGGSDGMRVTLVDETGQKASAVGQDPPVVVVRTAGGGRVIGSAAVDPETSTATLSGVSLPKPGEHRLLVGIDGLKPVAVAVKVVPAVRAVADVRVLSDMLDPPVDPSHLLRRWIGRTTDYPEDLIRLTNVMSSMQAGVSFRVTLHPDPTGILPPPLFALEKLRKAASVGALKGTLPKELWSGDSVHTAAGDVTLTHPYRVIAEGAAFGGGAAAAAAAVKFDGLPERVWAGQPFSVGIRFVHPQYAQKPAAVSGAKATFTLQSGKGALTSPAPRSLGPDRQHAGVPGLSISEAGPDNVLRVEVEFEDGSTASATSPAFEVLEGAFHHQWCDDYPEMCPDLKKVPPPPLLLSHDDKQRHLNLKSAVPATTTAAPAALVVREPAADSVVQPLVRNCLPLLHDVVQIEEGVRSEVRDDSRQLCMWALDHTRASFEGVACSEEDQDRCNAVAALSRELDRAAPKVLAAGSAARDCVLSSCRPDHKSAWLQAEQRLGSTCDAAPPLMLTRKGAHGNSAAVSVAALAVSSFVVWMFYISRDIATAEPPPDRGQDGTYYNNQQREPPPPNFSARPV